MINNNVKNSYFTLKRYENIIDLNNGGNHKSILNSEINSKHSNSTVKRRN